jgi:hypothetical protein
MNLAALFWILAIALALLALILHWTIDPWWGVFLLGIAGLGGLFLGDRKV